VGLIGEVTKEGIAKVQSIVDKTHAAFKKHVLSARPNMVKHIDQISTGDIWLGYDALEVGLIDRVVTSDEYIGEKLQEGLRVLRLMKYKKQRFLFGGPLQGGPIGFSSTFTESFQDIRKLTKILIDSFIGTGKRPDMNSFIFSRAMGAKNTQGCLNSASLMTAAI